MEEMLNEGGQYWRIARLESQESQFCDCFPDVGEEDGTADGLRFGEEQEEGHQAERWAHESAAKILRNAEAAVIFCVLMDSYYGVIHFD